MAVSNHERVGRALTILRDGIRPVLEKTWEAFYGEDWLSMVNGLDRYPDREASPDDLAFLLKGIWNTWQPIFGHQFGHAERNYVSELREGRNRWAHNESFTTDATYRLLDTAELLLQAFSAGEQAAAVRTMKQDLLRQRYAEEARTEQRRVATAPTKGEPSAGLSPWREVVVPHPDVREGRYQQAEFAADLHQVATGIADEEYQDPVAFYRRTFITDGLRDLLVNAARRLSGDGGDPVVGLQTNFGGGKTHSLIALYHLASGIPATDLPGVGEIFAEHGLSLPPSIRRAVFVGHMHNSPAFTHRKDDGTEVHTIWGEIAWQLGGADGYAILAEADREAKNPGAKLIDLFKAVGPALILIDEWVAYARQLPDRGHSELPAGDFDTQFTFAQALTEAAASVENVLVLVSTPESANEVGGERGREALTKLENVVFRKALRWQPATADETFEIVRRRLFEPIAPEEARVRDGVIKEFSDFYRKEVGEFPSEAKEAEYRRRMEAAYPIHPELFDRLYADWSTLDRFQRTRGVLRLMAAVINQLWKRDDRSLLIMPGTLPLDASSVVSELTKYLEEGWEPVIKSDVDGPNSLPLRIDQHDPRMGRYSAARRVARTVYMGSAPKAEGRRGIDIKRIVLGSAQPGESPGIFRDALRRLSDEATYLYVDGAKSQYWYSLQPNITRLARDRAESNFTDDDADREVHERLASAPNNGFRYVHAFADGPGDVPDEADDVRLVILPLKHEHVSNDMTSPAVRAAAAILEQRQGGPRVNRNMLVFLAADSKNRIAELRSAVRQYLSWKSIVADKDELNLNPQQAAQAESKLKDADDTVNRRIAEAYQLVLTPSQSVGSSSIEWHQTRVSANGSIAERVAKKLEAEEKLIRSYSGIRVRMDLDRVPLWGESGDISVQKLWSYYAQYLYMPRLASFSVLTKAIADGAASFTWEDDTFAVAEAHDAERDRYLGLRAGEHVEVGHSSTLRIVKPDRAKAQLEERGELPEAPEPEPIQAAPRAPTRFYGRKELDPVRAIRDMESILDEVVTQLGRATGTEVTITVEVNATSEAFDDNIRRAVSENATNLGFQTHEFDE